MKDTSNIALRSSRNQLLGLLFSTKVQAYSGCIPSDHRNHFLRVSYQGAEAKPRVSVTLVRKSAAAEGVQLPSFAVVDSNHLLINLAQEPTSIDDIVRAWADRDGFHLESVHTSGNVFTLPAFIDLQAVQADDSSKGYGVDLPTDSPDSFLRIKHTGSGVGGTQIPQVRIVQRPNSLHLLPASFLVSNQHQLTISISQSPFALEDLLEAWEEQSGFSLEILQATGKISPYGPLALGTSITLSPADQVITYPVLDLPILYSPFVESLESSVVKIVYVIGAEKSDQITYALKDENGDPLDPGPTKNPQLLELADEDNFTAFVNAFIDADAIISGWEVFMSGLLDPSLKTFKKVMEDCLFLQEKKRLVFANLNSQQKEEIKVALRSTFDGPTTLVDFQQDDFKQNLIQAFKKKIKGIFKDSWRRVLKMETPPITQNISYRIQPQKIGLDGKRFLSCSPSFRTTIKADLNLRLVQLDGDRVVQPLDSPATLDPANSYGIRISNSQMGINYQLYQVLEDVEGSISLFEPIELQRVSPDEHSITLATDTDDLLRISYRGRAEAPKVELRLSGSSIDFDKSSLASEGLLTIKTHLNKTPVRSIIAAWKEKEGEDQAFSFEFKRDLPDLMAPGNGADLIIKLQPIEPISDDTIFKVRAFRPWGLNAPSEEKVLKDPSDLSDWQLRGNVPFRTLIDFDFDPDQRACTFFIRIQQAEPLGFEVVKNAWETLGLTDKGGFSLTFESDEDLLSAIGPIPLEELGNAGRFTFQLMGEEEVSFITVTYNGSSNLPRVVVVHDPSISQPVLFETVAELDYNGIPNIKLSLVQPGVSYELFAINLPVSSSFLENSAYRPEGVLRDTLDISSLIARLDQDALPVFTFLQTNGQGHSPPDINSVPASQRLKEDCMLFIKAKKTDGTFAWLAKYLIALLRPNTEPAGIIIDREQIQIPTPQVGVAYQLRNRGTGAEIGAAALTGTNRIGWLSNGRELGMRIDPRISHLPTSPSSGDFFKIDGESNNDLLILPLPDDTEIEVMAIKEYTGLTAMLNLESIAPEE